MNTLCAEKAVILTVPAESSMMLVIRMTTAGVLGRSGLTIEDMDDLKMAAEEACNCLIRSSGCSELTVRYDLRDGTFLLRAEAGACPCPNHVEIPADELAVIRVVLLSMVDDVELMFEGKGLRGIELRKRLPE